MKLSKTEVYRLLTQIPKGKVSTYKIMAEAMGTKAYRGIGQILKRNPNAPQVPCHRIVRTSGELGGYNGTETERKAELLKSEGLNIENSKVINLDSVIFKGFKI